MLTKLSLEARVALAVTINAFPVSIAVRNLTLVVPQTALLSLPAGIADAAPIRCKMQGDACIFQLTREGKFYGSHLQYSPLPLQRVGHTPEIEPQRLSVRVPLGDIKYKRLTLTAIVRSEARVALAMSRLTLPVSGAPVRTPFRHLFRYVADENDLRGIAVVVIKTEEPVTSVQEIT